MIPTESCYKDVLGSEERLLTSRCEHRAVEMANWNAGRRCVRQLLEQLFSFGEPESQEETESESEKEATTQPADELLAVPLPFFYIFFHSAACDNFCFYL